MAGMSGAPAPKPASLNSPVPGKEAQLSADDFLSSFDAPPAPGKETAAEISADEFLNASTETIEAAPPEDFAVSESPSVFGIDTDIMQQLKDAPERIAANIAGSPEAVRLTLENRLGKENVRVRRGEVFFKKTGDKAFRKLDPGTFEVVNDLFSDFYKETLQTLGGAGGALVGATGVNPFSVAAGTAVGVAAATTATDAYGEQRLGVVRPKGDFLNQKAGVIGDLARGAERAGEALAEGAQYAMLDGVFKGLASKFAGRRARLDGLKQLAEVSPMDRLQEGVRQNLDTLADLKNLGLTQKIAGTNIEVPAHQLLPHLREVSKVAESVAAEKSFQQAQKEAAENFGRVSLDLAEEAMGLSVGRLRSAVKTGTPSTKEIASADINGLFNSVRQAEGKLIGEFRDKAKAIARKNPLPTPKTAEAIRDSFSRLGVQMRDGNLIFPKDDALAQVLGTDSKAFIGGLKADLNMLNKKLTKGGLNLDELLGQSQIIGAKNDGARRIGGPYKAIIGKLSSAIRSDSRDAMSLVLSPEDAIEYGAKMKRFSSISKSMEQLDSYLRDDIGMNTFAKGLVSRGKEGLPNLRAAKEFLLQEDPQMYKNLIGEYMEELALKHRKPGSTAGFDPAAMRKDLVGLGSEYLDELMPKNGKIDKGIVLRSFDLADQLERSIIRGSDSEVIQNARKAVGALSWYHRGVNAASSMLRLSSKNSRLLKILSREGVESFLTATPPKNRDGMRQTLNALLSLGRQEGTLAALNPQAPESLRAE